MGPLTACRGERQAATEAETVAATAQPLAPAKTTHARPESSMCRQWIWEEARPETCTCGRWIWEEADYSPHCTVGGIMQLPPGIRFGWKFCGTCHDYFVFCREGTARRARGACARGALFHDLLQDVHNMSTIAHLTVAGVPLDKSAPHLTAARAPRNPAPQSIDKSDSIRLRHYCAR